MKKFGFILALFCIGYAQPAHAEDPKGPWYGSFNSRIGNIEFSIDLDQLADGRSGTASISFIKAAPEFRCPREAHPSLCKELEARAKRSPNGAFFAESEGVLYEGEDEAFVAFRFPDEIEARLVVIHRNSPESEMAGIRFYHPKRGIDVQIDARQDQHFCEVTQCSSEVRNELKDNPNKALGLFGTRSFLFGFNPNLDERAIAHQITSRPTKQNNGFGKYESVGQYLTAVWNVTSSEDLDLGQLRLFGTGTKVWGGQGELVTQANGSDNLAPVELTENGRNELFVNFTVKHTRSNRTPEKDVDELRIYLPPLPQNKISAIMARPGVNNRVILERVGTYEGEFEGDADELPIEQDLTNLRFGLRNVPADRELLVRDSPNRNSRAIGQLSASTNDLHVSRCEPTINQLQFAEASLEGKLELLGGVWCQVSSREAGVENGFILGRYLSPFKQ